MNFVAQVEEHLRDLGTEARKKHPGVKEASERGILQLRSLQNDYVGAVRRATSSGGKHPTTGIFASQDVLRPFLLACNYPDASSHILDIALEGIQLLLDGNAVCADDGVHIGRVLSIQAHVVFCTLQQHLLNQSPNQSLLPPTLILSNPNDYEKKSSILEDANNICSSNTGIGTNNVRSTNWKDEEHIALHLMHTVRLLVNSPTVALTEEVLQTCLSVSMILAHVGGDIPPAFNNNSNHHHAKYLASIHTIRPVATATIRQILTSLYQRTFGVGKENKSEEVTPNDLLRKASLHCFQDLLHFLSPNEKQDEQKQLKGPLWLASISQNKHHISQMCPGTCLNIIHSLILQHLNIITTDEEFLKLLEDHLFPIMLEMNRNPPTSTFVLPSTINTSNAGRWGSKSPARGHTAGISLHPNSDSWKSMHFFTWMLRWNQLSWTLLCVYYEKLPVLCCNLILEMLQNIIDCVEGYRHSDVFDDGYVFVGVDSDIQSLQDVMSNVKKNKNKTLHTIADTHNDTVVSNAELWRCALSLETIYQLVTHHLDVLKTLEKVKDSSLISKIMGTIGEFTNIVTSFRGNILYAVATAHYHQPIPSTNWEPICPMIQNYANDIVKSFDEWDTAQIEMNGSPHSQQSHQQSSFLFASTQNKSLPDNSYQKAQVLQLNQWDGSYTIPTCDVGEIVWVGLNCILSTCQFSSEKEFPPLLTVLQHFLKRFPGSDVLTKCILVGYINLANAIIPLDNKLQQKAILTSLCKITVPSGLKSSQSGYFNEYHMNALSALVQIAHVNNNNFSKDDWYILLSTLEHISSLPSSHFSDVSKLFLRVSTFTTCLSEESLGIFMDALISLSKISTFNENSLSKDTLMIMPSEEPPQQSYDKNTKETSFGGKLISFAGRALLGASNSVVGGMDLSESEYNVEESSNIKTSRFCKTFAQDFYVSVYNKLVQSKPNTEKEIFLTLSFSLVLLTDIIIENSFRFAAFGEAATNYFRLIASKCPTAEIRLFAIDSLANLTATGLTNVAAKAESGNSSSDNFFPEVVASSNVLSLDDIFTVEVKALVEEADESKNKAALEKLQKRHLSILNIPHGKLLTPLCETITKTPHRDVAEAGLNALHVILEGTGHNLSGEAWSIIIDAISALSGCDTESLLFDDNIDRSSSEWATCSSLAFRCLKLIVDDFLEELPSGELSTSTRTALLDCCAAFGGSCHDLNTSLTATGMLWTIADQNSSPSSLDHVLSKLALLATDERVEVRNCSVNTLFSCLVGVGHKFTADQWRLCLNETIFGVLDQVSSKGKDEENGSDPGNKKSTNNHSEEKKNNRYRVSVHHSRDSAIKQWATTQVLTLRGLERVLRQFFDTLLSTTVQSSDNSDSTNLSWFESGWERILKQSFQCSTQIGGRETLEVRLAGVDLLILCVQLSSVDGIGAATTPARVGTNMKVVNGALRSVRTTNSTTVSVSSQQKSERRNDVCAKERFNRHRLFLKSFDGLMRFQSYLNDESALQLEANIDKSSYFETPLLQVLTRLSQGLTKLYDCCKSNEMAPKSLSQYNSPIEESNHYNDDYEGKVVNLVSLVMKRACAGENGSRFLTQCQRLCLDMLQQMAFNSSSKALESLAEIGDVTLFGFKSSNTQILDSQSGNYDSELLEFEAAKVITKIYEKQDILHKSKVVVLDFMLGEIINYQNRTTNFENQSETNITCGNNGTKNNIDKDAFFDILASIFEGGLEAADFMEKNILTTQFGDPRIAYSLLEEVWSKAICFLLILLGNGHNGQVSFAPSTKSILGFISSINSFAPRQKYDELGTAFLDGVMYSVKNYRLVAESTDAQPGDSENFFALFEACYNGLCKCSPNSQILQSTTVKLLIDVINALSSHAMYEDRVFRTNVKIAIHVCKTLFQGQNTDKTILHAFPYLTKLVTIDSSELRQEVSAVLSKIDISDILTRLETAEKRSIKAKEQIEKLTIDINNYEIEREKSSRLKSEADDLTSQLMKEVERLKAKNDELERQVVVFSEESAYT